MNARGYYPPILWPELWRPKYTGSDRVSSVAEASPGQDEPERYTAPLLQRVLDSYLGLPGPNSESLRPR